jgi:hypothetical protein
MTQLKLIYDDSVSVVPEVTDIVGIRHYGDLLHGKKRLSSIITESAAGAGINDILHIRQLNDLKTFAERLGHQQVGLRFLYLPSNIVALGGRQVLTDLFGKLRWLRQNVLVTASTGQGGWSGAASVDLDTFRHLIDQRCAGTIQGLQGERRGNFADIGNGAGLIDLSDKARLLKFLGTHFDVRHFNAISYDDHVIRKSSRNKDKIHQEFNYWGLLPDEMKFWFVQPYDLRDDGETASYAMERLNIPDMALQWIHGAVSMDAFNRFLDRAFYFLQQRPARKIESHEATKHRHTLYRDKVTARVTDLQKSTHAPQINNLLKVRDTGSSIDRFDNLVGRYFALLDRLEPRRSERLAVIGHGDFCFSNILYEKGSNLMRLIDPRGASKDDDLWTDPYYDVAKLSHSILGSYDFINNGLYDVTLDEALAPMLNLYIASPLEEMQQAFKERLIRHGFDLPLVRLYEASLFLSMVPLHIDVPSKALAFLMNADTILTKLEISADL